MTMPKACCRLSQRTDALPSLSEIARADLRVIYVCRGACDAAAASLLIFWSTVASRGSVHDDIGLDAVKIV